MKIGDISMNSVNGFGFYIDRGKRYMTVGLSSSIRVDKDGHKIGQAFSHEPTDEVEPDSTELLKIERDNYRNLLDKLRKDKSLWRTSGAGGQD